MDDDPGRALDEYLVPMSQGGSLEALADLARRWTPRLLRYAARVLAGVGDSADAARDVQDPWVSAIRGLQGLRDPAQFPAWIYGIATRRWPIHRAAVHLFYREDLSVEFPTEGDSRRRRIS